MRQKTHIDITIDSEVYHHVKNTLPYGKISETVNELLSQFLQAKKCDIDDTLIIDQQIEEKLIEMERISGEITVLKIRKSDLLKVQAEQEKEDNIKRKAFAQSMINAGFVRDMRG